MSLSGKYSNQLTIIIILLIGIGARTYFARELHPNSDEYVSMLASQAVQSSGLPVLPSGLFYTNGFLFSWIGTGKQLQDLLKQSDQVWFVVSESVYDNYFRGDWHFVEQQNMKLVWQDDAALVYRSRDPGILLPNQPDHIVDANLSNLVQLRGYSSALAGPAYRVFLFWNVLSPLPDNFTQFVHIRNEKGETVAQADFQPLEGLYIGLNRAKN